MPPSLAVLLAGALFATGGALIKSSEVPSLQRAALRAAFAALTILALLPAARRWPTGAMVRLLLPYFGATALFVVANTLTTAANTIFLQSTATLWIVALSPWLIGERPSRRDLAVLVGVAFGTTLCFVAPVQVLRTAPEPRLGDLFALGSGVSYALLLLGMRWLSRTHGDQSAAAIVWCNAFTAPLSLLLMPMVGQTPVMGTQRDWLVIAVLGVFQVGLAYVLLVRAIAHVPAMRASLLLMIEPALNPVFAYFVHGETPHALVLTGGVVILASVAAGALRPAARAAAPPAGTG